MQRYPYLTVFLNKVDKELFNNLSKTCNRFKQCYVEGSGLLRDRQGMSCEQLVNLRCGPGLEGLIQVFGHPVQII